MLLADTTCDGLEGDLHADVARRRRLRDALRRLAAELTDDPRPAAASAIADRADAITALNETCALATAWPALVWPLDGPPRASARTTQPLSTVAVARLAAQAVLLLTRPSALGVCEAPGCVRYVVRDRPRRGWCSAACGNRARVARHYRRHHGADR